MRYIGQQPVIYSFKDDCVRNLRRQCGFSLIELLIVVAIILIIAAIAIPNLLRARIAANEGSAVGSVKTITTSEFTYASTFGIGFAPLTNLAGASPCTSTTNSACLIDSNLGGGTKSGYTFYTPAPTALGTMSIPNTSFTINADPIARGQSGQRSFFGDESGVIRFNAAAVATATDTPVQ